MMSFCLGCADSLPNLRKDFETRSGISGKAIRIEKICYTSKEGKSPQGCPIAKWVRDLSEMVCFLHYTN